MRTNIALLSTLAALAALVPTAAFAQDPAPAPAPAAVPPPAEVPPAPAGAAPSNPVAEAPATTAEPAPTTAAEAAPTGPTPAPGWMRIDSDFFGLQIWGGGTLPLIDGVGLAMDIYTNALVPGYATSSFGEFDIGPAITAGPFVATPMIGLQMDFAAHKAAALVPQFYLTGGPGPIYAELWFQYYNYKVFDGASNQINMRLFVDYKLSDYVAIGPQIELNYDSVGIPNVAGEAKKVYKMPVGGNVMFTNLGVNSTLLAFVGYETGEPYGLDNHLAGRLTYLHNF
ncbi:MAG: putative secreted protein [Polyangiaceae bacterium]|nr:putative secreted protein [Polyangiaceae bacterium]